MEAARENVPLQHGTFPKNTEKDCSRPLFLTAYIFPGIVRDNSIIAGWNLVPLHGARTSSAKNMVSGCIGSCKSARAALLLLLTLLPFRFTLPLLFTLDELLLLLPGDRSHQMLTTKSPDKIRLDFIFFFFRRFSSRHIKAFAFQRFS